MTVRYDISCGRPSPEFVPQGIACLWQRSIAATERDSASGADHAVELEANDVCGPESGPNAGLDRRTGRALKKLWADGLSASQIAGELGGITRNAVIGKVHRLGLSGRAKAPPPPCRARASRALPPMFRAPRPMMRGNTALRAAYDYDTEPEPELIENIIPIGQRCTLLELDDEQLPLADRRSGSARLLLLRRQDQRRHSVLRLSRRASPISRRQPRRDRRPSR